MIHYKPESTPAGDRLNSDSTKIREGQGAPQEGSEEIAALRARSRHEKIISLHVVFESRHT